MGLGVERAYHPFRGDDAIHDPWWVITEQPDKALDDIFKGAEYSCTEFIAANDQ